MTTENQLEEELLKRLATGDEEAFRMLFDEHRDTIYSFALKFLLREELAEELVQDVFLKIWLSRTALSGIENFGGFLYTVARNLSLSRLKRMAQERQILSHLAQRKKFNELTEDTVLHRDYQKLLRAAIDALPHQQRRVYILSKEEGLSRQEIADRLGIAPNTVKAHLTAATLTLRNWFGRHRGEMLALFIVLHGSR